MANLVLVDLDNVFGAWKDYCRENLRTISLPVYPCAPPNRDLGAWLSHADNGAEAPAPGAGTVVVVVCNTATLREIGAGWMFFTRFAELTASVLGCTSPVTLEPVVVLTAPEAADVALVRLVRESPSEAGAGEFEHVWLVSRDRGLRYELSRHLRSRCDATNSRLVHHVRRQALVRRAAPAVPLPAATNPARPALAWSTYIESDPGAAWASAQLVNEPAADTSPQSFATRVDGRPGYLSQVGLTARRSVGVSRLAERIQTRRPPVVGPCSPADGLEMAPPEAQPPPPGATLGVRPSLLGSGAVRVTVRGGEVTVATRLPMPCLTVLGGPPLRQGVHGPELDDELAVRNLPPGVPIIAGNAWAQLYCARENEAVVASIEPGRLGPALWEWRGGGTTGKSKVRVERAAQLMPARQFRIQVALMPELAGASACLRLVSRYDGDVEIVEPIDAGRIGIGYVSGRCGREEYAVAVLAAWQPLGPGSYACTRIHTVEDPPLPHRDARVGGLGQLPLLVPPPPPP